MTLDFNEVVEFMKEFKVDLLNRFGELIIDEPTNTYVGINRCKDIEEVKLYVVFALCRPIGKGLDERDANRLLKRFNEYFKVNLTRSDLRLMYQELCYERELERFKDFIKRGFPVDELNKANV
ncbi:hypothetical protein ACFFF5_21145 [Lederbergia wuyishanensis]|uniref:LAGLIDADG homing endonuclease n=1 Tax=Lederbergia wuyishanensis TaxID=1347903 RepID=A0ABU0D751_9BACI|nr:hypothetical protein [Lederbergia wuyishanensis]MCJ8008923.1 hypothetical protein [Lederbergia wuyishanensis]MDQ0344249.1 hypothetical protein [Lederbergia wuyishanensis]